MQEGSSLAVSPDILAKQEALGRRLLWLLMLPSGITVALAFLFFTLSVRIADVEIAMQIVTIERYLLVDKNYSGAIDQYEKIAETYPRAPILARLGLLYFQLDARDPKKREAAITTLTRARNVDPAYWETYRNLTYIYTLTEHPGQAIEAGKKALELNQFDANTYNNVAWVHATSKEPPFRNLARAVEYAGKAVKLTNERQPHFLDTLAEVYFQRNEPGDRGLAMKYMRQAIEISPPAELKIFYARFKSLFPNEPLTQDKRGM